MQQEKRTYEKLALSYEQQADRLLDRGLCADRSELLHRLQQVSYYRLSGYMHPYRERNEENEVLDRFRDGTTLEDVWARYCFDRRLRVLMLDAIERIEVAIRTKLVYAHAHEHGPFGYTHHESIPKLNQGDYLNWRLSLQEETSRSKESFKKHFFDKYDHKALPIWMLAELMSMGSTLTLFKGVEPSLKQKTAADYGLVDAVLWNWLTCLNAARNICAHHSRFWNITLGYKPLFPKPKKYPEWHGKNKLPNDRSGSLIFICRYLLDKISPSSQWHRRVENLFQEYPSIPPEALGLPENWQTHPIWNPPAT